MYSIAEAMSLIDQHAESLPSVTLPVEESLGTVLAESIACPVPIPPHDKSMMDGYAVRVNDVQQSGAVLRVIEQVHAGQVPQLALTQGTATRIMTGAPVPVGATAVVPVEHTASLAANAGDIGHATEQVVVHQVPRGLGQHIQPRGAIMRQGEIVLRAGHGVRPLELGLAAELGRTHWQVVPRPSVAILATGDELVPAGQPLASGQIWNSNGPLLAACVRQIGAQAESLGIVADDEPALVDAIECGLQRDVLVLSGGVSMGAKDLVPKILQRLGVEQIFHKVRVKPGKPVWFGHRRDAQRTPLVFGLPGNPVSSFVCFQLFVRPALAKLAGRATAESPLRLGPLRPGQLTASFTHRGDRPTYFPASAAPGHGIIELTPLDWKGSADLRTLCDANCLLCFPGGDRQYAPGDAIPYVPIDG